MQIAIGLYPGFTALDAIGPYQVLSQLPGAQVVFTAVHTGHLRDDTVLTVNIDTPISELPRPDIILIPGGMATRKLLGGDPLVDWVRDVHATTTWTTSVCTGALVLGAAGLLKGLQATTHWATADSLKEFGATYTRERVVRSGKIVMAAGVSAGIDMALTLAAEIAGPMVAQAIQLGIEYDPQPPFDSGSPDKADPAVCDLIRSLLSAGSAKALAE
jgi:putative intracellular protease/amidase